MEIPRFGVPVDVAQWGAVVLGGATIAWGARLGAIARRHERWAVAVLAGVAALLSWGYVGAYLRGGPRIIDATSYFLEARGLAGGHVTFPVGESETSVLGRFLVRSEGASGVGAAVLFPPGYPAVLALGFAVGAPLAVGPALAALLVIATYALAREVVRVASGEGSHSAGSAGLEGVPVIAAALSAACGALRYHTAETMSHGLAALCFAGGVTFLLRARATGEAMRGRLVSAAIAGLFGGWLFATRPASGLAMGVVGLAVLFADRPENKGDPESARGALGGLSLLDRGRLVGAAIGGAAPFVVLFAVHQRLATGQWGVTTHAACYALNDGPAGCFRYGFGEGIGCYGEHGDFVRANLPRGFGFVAAVKTTARRLWMHLVDAGNVEPLVLLVPAGAALAWRRWGARVMGVAIGALVAAYVPFYFDGNYPGGGARLFADGLPFEHVLLAIAGVGIAARTGTPPAARGAAPPRARRLGGADGAQERSDEHRPGVGIHDMRSGAWIVGVSLIGFGVRAGFDHAQLRDRDGGAPLFVARDLEASGITKGLIFAESDAAFNLAFDPEGRASGVEGVRRKGDAIDAFVWREHGEPEAFTLSFVAPKDGGRGHAVVEPYAPSEAKTPWIEGGSLWPPRAQIGGAFALPAFAGGTCARAMRLLRVFRGANAGDPARGEVRVGLPAKLVRGRAIDVGLLVGPGGAHSGEAAADAAIVVDGTRTPVSIAVPGVGAPACLRGRLSAVVPVGARRVEIAILPRWEGVSDPEEQPLVAVDRVALDAR